MSRITEEQREILSFIDAIVALLEKSDYGKLEIPDIESLHISINPFEFLLNIIEKFVSYEEMVEWLTKFLTYILPVLELGVKGILLTNLKKTIDCNIDPIIPNYLREDGIDINLQSIDYKNILSISPMSRDGQAFYFGTKMNYSIDNGNEDIIGNKFFSYEDACYFAEENNISVSNIKESGDISNIYELVRAQDFNAFLWFVINKARFLIDEENEKWDVFSVKELVENDVNHSTYSPGYVISDGYENHNLSLCTNVSSSLVDGHEQLQYSNALNKNDVSNEQRMLDIISNKNINAKFVPIANIFNGCNWYVNSDTYFQYLSIQGESISRNYEKDKGICQISFNSSLKNKSTFLGLSSNNINFKILPKPFINVGNVNVNFESENKITIEPFKKILFDKDGNPNKNGNYSILVDTIVKNEEDKISYFYLSNGGHVTFDWVNGNYSGDTDEIKKSLYECYPNLTVYEFNYDFVMGMKLFDPSVVANQLIENVTNLIYDSGNINIDISKTIYEKKISEIVKKVIESTDYTASDCFFSFSNEKYESMLHEAELKRSQLYEFNDSVERNVKLNPNEIFDILSEFDNNGTLVENSEVIKRTFLRASDIISSGANDEDKYNIKIGFISDIIKSLVTIIVESLLTPKVVLLFKINKELMGGDKDLTFEEFLSSIITLLVDIVKEIRDLVLNEILQWAKEILGKLIERMAELLFLEQIEYYHRLMKLLFKACSFKLKRNDSQIDLVDYADIDKPIDQPINNEC